MTFLFEFSPKKGIACAFTKAPQLLKNFQCLINNSRSISNHGRSIAVIFPRGLRRTHLPIWNVQTRWGSSKNWVKRWNKERGIQKSFWMLYTPSCESTINTPEEDEEAKEKTRRRSVTQSGGSVRMLIGRNVQFGFPCWRKWSANREK